MNCPIFLGAAHGYADFELNEEEESIFATVVRENRGLTIIKIAALINHLLQRFGHIPNFIPTHFFPHYRYYPIHAHEIIRYEKKN